MEWQSVLWPFGGYHPDFDRAGVYEFRRVGEETGDVFRLSDCHPLFNATPPPPGKPSLRQHRPGNPPMPP
jgi:hypothetical protein